MRRISAPPAPIGWPLLPVPDAGGRLAFPSLEESVRQQIRVILLTRRGEQLMRPDYGAGLDEMLHEPNTLVTRRRIRDRIAEGLARWESRITVDGIEVWELPDDPTRVRVEIGYRHRRTGAAERLGFVLETEA
jgi:uncharacterized protein